MYIFWFVVIIVVLIVVHELGHFLVAKWSGMRVDEFGLGFPPKLWSIKKGETEYSLNAIPFGGFVRIYGEDPSAEGEMGERSFGAQPLWKQALVLVAGVVCNALFAWVLIAVGFMIGTPVPADLARNTDDVYLKVIQTEAGSVADESGLQGGDVLVSASDANNELTDLTDESLTAFLETHPNEEVVIAYTRGDEEREAVLMPVPDDPLRGLEIGMIGFLNLNPLEALWASGVTTMVMLGEITKGLGDFLWQAVRGQADMNTVAGPVGIAGLVGDVSALGFVYVLNFIAIISLHLTVINLIPFPALDGGRLLFVLFEGVVRRPVPPHIANSLNALGFFLLIALMVVVTYHDITKLL